ncbi:hypothetical protein D9M68_804070 [compost metagenome]
MNTGVNFIPKISCDFEKSKPKIWTGSTAVMPLGPLVMLTGRSRLFMKMRMISPKPSVTMAR